MRPVTVHDCPQGSDEWWRLRVGVPSVSSLTRIITPAKLEYSASARGYASDLIGERLLGDVMERTSSLWTEYGQAGEDFARQWYEWHYEVEVQQVGSITTELVRTDKEGVPVVEEGGEFVTDTFLGSPDGLIGDDGIVEIKCPKATTHMQYLTGHKDLAGEYRMQIEGYLWLTGRGWCDIVSFNPDLPKKRVRAYPTPSIQNLIGAHLERFFREMALAESRIRAMGDVIEEDEEVRWTLNQSLEVTP